MLSICTKFEALYILIFLILLLFLHYLAKTFLLAVCYSHRARDKVLLI